jgi:hypothetical protein
MTPPHTVLVPFCFWSPRPSETGLAPNAPDVAWLSTAIAAHLAGLGWPDAEPLRWAITAVDPLRGLQLEGVGICEAAAGPQDTA